MVVFALRYTIGSAPCSANLRQAAILNFVGLGSYISAKITSVGVAKFSEDILNHIRPIMMKSQ